MAWAFVSTIGTNNTKTSGSTLNINAPVGGIPVGAVIVLSGSATGNNLTTSSPLGSDTRNNTYVTMAHTSGTGNSAGTCVLAAVVTTALVNGDVITLNFNATFSAMAATADQFSGGSSVADNSASNTNASTNTTPTSGSVTPTVANCLMFGCVGVNGPIGDTFTQATGFTVTTRVGTTGGSATSNITHNPAFLIETTATAQNYNPTLGTARLWADILQAIQLPPLPPNVEPPHSVLQAVNRAAIW